MVNQNIGLTYKKASPFVATIIIFIAIAIFLSLYSTTPQGLGLSPDSVAYLKAASGFIDGKGFVYFTSQWPPLYPTLIGVIGITLNENSLNSARILQCLLYSLNFIIIFIILTEAKLLRPVVIICFSILLCLQAPITYVHYYAWSEPLFIFLLLVDLFLLQKILSRTVANNNVSYLVVMILIISILIIYTRYIGFAVAIANAIIFGTTRQISIKTRLMVISAQLVLPLALIYPWFQYRSSFQDTNTTAGFAFQGLSIDRLLVGLGNVGRWFAPNDQSVDYNGGTLLHEVLGASVFLGGLCILVMLIKRHQARFCSLDLAIPANVYIIISGLLIVYTYIGGLLFFIFYLAAGITLENRYLAIIFIPSFIILILFAAALKNKVISVILLIGIMCSLLLFYKEFKSRVFASYFNGIELSAKSVRDKPIANFLRNCSTKAVVAADYPWHFDLDFDSKVQWLPRSVYYGSNKLNSRFLDDLELLSHQVNVVVIEDSNNELNAFFERQTNYKKIFDADGIVWLNMMNQTAICNKTTN